MATRGHPQVSFRADRGLTRQLDQLCKETGLSRSQVLRVAISTLYRLSPTIRKLTVDGELSKQRKPGEVEAA